MVIWAVFGVSLLLVTFGGQYIDRKSTLFIPKLHIQLQTGQFTGDQNRGAVLANEQVSTLHGTTSLMKQERVHV